MNSIDKAPLQLAAEAIDALFTPGDVVELRIYGSAFGEKRVVAAGFFTSHAALAKSVFACSDGNLPSGYEVTAVYYTLNPVSSTLLKRYRPNSLHRDPHLGVTKDKDIVKRTNLLIDCDPKRDADVSATDAEKQGALLIAPRVRDFLTSRGWPLPIECDSGNGCHILYRVDLPNDNETHALFRNSLSALASRFDTDKVKIDQSVHNASRVTKGYGSIARKGPHTRERPHRRSRIVSAPARIETVSLELLAALASESPTPVRVVSSSNTSASVIPPEVFEAQLDLVGIEHEGASAYEGGWIWRPAECVFNSDHRRNSIIVGMRATGALFYRCLHNSCIDNKWERFRAEVERRSCKRMRFRETGAEAPDSLVRMWIRNDGKAWEAWNGEGDLDAAINYLAAFVRSRGVGLDQWLRIFDAAPLKAKHDALVPEHVRSL
jgi:hypothetical protein